MTEEAKVRSLQLDLTRGYQFDIAFDPEVRAIVADEPAPLGEGKGWDAARLLGAAVGNCLSASLLFCARKSRVEVQSISTTVDVSIVRNERGRMRVGSLDVRITVGLDEENGQRLTRCATLFEDYCVVTASVRQAFPVRVALVDTAGNSYAVAGEEPALSSR